VWTSPDGLGWTRVPHDPAVFPVGASMESILATNEGIVAVGQRDLELHAAAVWTSPDGLNWSRVPDTASGEPGHSNP
jgi:hypothetical protein